MTQRPCAEMYPPLGFFCDHPCGPAAGERDLRDPAPEEQGAAPFPKQICQHAGHVTRTTLGVVGVSAVDPVEQVAHDAGAGLELVVGGARETARDRCHQLDHPRVGDVLAQDLTRLLALQGRVLLRGGGDIPGKLGILLRPDTRDQGLGHGSESAVVAPNPALLVRELAHEHLHVLAELPWHDELRAASLVHHPAEVVDLDELDPILSVDLLQLPVGDPARPAAIDHVGRGIEAKALAFEVRGVAARNGVLLEHENAVALLDQGVPRHQP